MTVMHQPEPLTATPTDWVVEDVPAGTFHHSGQSCRGTDELQMRAFWRQWQTLMSAG